MVTFSVKAPLLLLTVGACIASQAKEPALASVTWTSEDGYQLRELDDKSILSTIKDSVVTANFTDALFQTGWSYLEITTNEQFTDDRQAYAAGFIEGYLTAEQINYYWINNFDNYCAGDNAELCAKLTDYLTDNQKWIEENIDPDCGQNNKTCDPYWHQVDLFYGQMRGIGAGYRARATKKDLPLPVLTDAQIYFMNIFGDMEDLSEALNYQYHLNVPSKRVLGSGRCSALIKLLPGYEDLYISQVAWQPYQAAMRIMKKYNMALSTDKSPGSRVPGQTMSFSGYPGIIYSGDDFTIMSPSGLTSLETTIGNYNEELWKFVSPTDSVLEGIRSTVANRLATSAGEWMRLFAKYNSGTYNNQWMVVDYNKFKPGPFARNTSDLLWVLEQLPGLVHYDDMTDKLFTDGYWPSFNIPYFEDVFNSSGCADLADEYGDWWTNDKHPRALIFKRDHENIDGLKSMEKMMRYNDFENDPLSRCDCDPPYSAENGISARSDLNMPNGTYPFGALSYHNHGGIDFKITNYNLSKSLLIDAISSPTYDNQPPFKWSTAGFANEQPHYGLPDEWKFEAEIHEWYLP